MMMVKTPLCAFVGVAGALALVMPTHGDGGPDGPVWEEYEDAGSLPNSAQQTSGSGELTGIEGNLGTGAGGDIDLEDMYIIRVCDPAGFLATTVINHGGGSNFDTELWIFRADPINPNFGLGLLANDDYFYDPGQTIRSEVPPLSNDNSGAELTVPGRYFIAISGFDRNPAAPGGLIFDQQSRIEISGPDGTGGANPINGWITASGPATGSYHIKLLGCTYGSVQDIDCNCNGVVDGCDIMLGTSPDVNQNGIPDECEPACPPDVNGDGTVDVQDLLQLLSEWGNPGGPGDVNFDCVVDVQDLLMILASWGPCPGPEMGACCFPLTGDCQDMLESTCDAAGGNFQGAGTECATTNCPAFITTLYAANNSGSLGGAVYFDVTVASNPLTITSYDTNTAELVTFDFDVYITDPGVSYAGNEANPTAWTLVATGTGTGMGVDQPSHVTLDNTFDLAANTSYGMALVMGPTAGHDYTNGPLGPYSNSALQLDLGSVTNVPFSGSPFTPRVWNGSIYYTVNSP